MYVHVHALHYPILSCPVLAYPVLPSSDLPYPVIPLCPTLYYPVLSLSLPCPYPVLTPSYPVLSHLRIASHHSAACCILHLEVSLASLGALREAGPAEPPAAPYPPGRDSILRKRPILRRSEAASPRTARRERSRPRSRTGLRGRIRTRNRSPRESQPFLCTPSSQSKRETPGASRPGDSYRCGLLLRELAVRGGRSSGGTAGSWFPRAPHPDVQPK